MKFEKEKIRQIIQEEIIKAVREEVENEVQDAQEAYEMLKMSMDYLDKGDMTSARQALESIEIYFDNELAGGEFSLDEETSDECHQAAETLRNCMKSSSGRPKSTETELGIMKEPIEVTPGKSAMGVKFVNEDDEDEQ